MVKIAINGFGRIGRMVLRIALENPTLDVVAINSTADAKSSAHLFKYDSVHGTYLKPVSHDEEHLIINEKKIRLFSDREPLNLPWGDLGVDIVIEATGKFTSREGANKHLLAGAKKVLITGPATDEDITVVYGVNHLQYNHATDHIVSNASCTTNCLAPLAKVLHETFGIENAFMTTIHSFTNDQNNLDNPHKDLRRTRACSQSIIPTTTGATKAVALVLPELKGKLNGMSMRVPTPNVSVVDLVANLHTQVTAEEVNEVLKQASEGAMRGVLSFTDEPLVSVDFIGASASSVVDGLSTLVVGDSSIKVIAWYDNEWGYSCRVVDVATHMASFIHEKPQIARL